MKRKLLRHSRYRHCDFLRRRAAIRKTEAQKNLQATVSPANVDESRLLHADQEPGNWMSYGRTYNEQRFSPLKQINDQNVGQLGLAWYVDLDVRRGQEATPIVVDGVMYFSTAWSKVFAVNAATGEKLWSYDPKVPPEWAVNACCDVVNRGVAVWRGKVFVGALDGRLIALDAATGKPVWETLTIDPKYSLHDHRRSARREGQSADRQRRRGNGRARLRVCVRCRHWQAWRGASTRSPVILRNRSKARRLRKPRKPGAANGGSSAAAGRFGTRSSTIPSSICFLSERATELPGIAARAARREKTICSLAPSWRSSQTRASTFGITRKSRAMHGTTMRLRQSFSPTSQSEALQEKFFFKLRRTDSSTYSIAPRDKSFPLSHTRRSRGRPGSICRQAVRSRAQRALRRRRQRRPAYSGPARRSHLALHVLQPANGIGLYSRGGGRILLQVGRTF